MAIEDFYKLKSEEYNKMISHFKDKIADIEVYDENGLECFRWIRGEAKEWFDDAKFSASQNGVKIGNRNNFAEVLQEQIDKAIKENKKEYADYIKAIRNFFVFYHNLF